MFIATTLAYPLALAVLCTGAGLLVEHLSGGPLGPGMLVISGVAALVAISQLCAYVHPLAPASPYVLAGAAAAGFALRWRAGARRLAGAVWPLTAGVGTYVLALAPVLASGRPTFSAYLALADSAVHMVGADYLISHGMSFGHLDLGNSYGQVVSAYYGSGYPSGADTLYGASSRLLGLSPLWTFQPFNAFMLACASAPAWALARLAGLGRRWSAAAAMCACAGALVYAYELIGSVKEISSLGLILGLGALACSNGRVLDRGRRAAIPFALLLAAGLSVLGAAFGVWAIVAVAVVVVRERAGLTAWRPRAASVVVAAGVVVACAWPTFVHLAASVRIANAIASTSNPGNLHSPPRASQLAGVWLNGSYKLAPAGVALTLTSILIALTLALAFAGIGALVLRRAWALCAWTALMLAAWLAVSAFATTWADAKTLMLTSPVVVLMAWAGAAHARARLGRALGLALGAVLLAGVLVSDALQYHSSNLAPNGRFEELASIDSRFGGRGPTLFTDFDEYALYALRDLDVGGPDFAFPPRAVAAAAGGRGLPVDIGRIAPAAWRPYRLVVTRRDPSLERPPYAYEPVWQGRYYQVYARRPGVAPALAHLELAANARARCMRVGAFARAFHVPRVMLAGAIAPSIIGVSLGSARHPRGWGREREGLVMGSAGALEARVVLPRAGTWEVWLEGGFMPQIEVSVDGRAVARIGGQLGGNSLVPDASGPYRVTLPGGSHTVIVRRLANVLAPGDGGGAVLGRLFFTPAHSGPEAAHMALVAPSRWRSLCGRPLEWVEAVRGEGASSA
jgi:hypothetical protein